MLTATVVPDSDAPLTPEHYQQLTLASARAKKIHNAARVAAFNGWVSAILAVCALPFAAFSITSFLATIGLAVVAYNEFRGRKLLLEFQPSATALLGWNQLGLLAMIVVYCLWMLYDGTSGLGALAGSHTRTSHELTGGLDAADIHRLIKIIFIVTYGTVIVSSLIFQGLNALYYFTRRKHVEAYLRETPQWVIDLQRMTSQT